MRQDVHRPSVIIPADYQFVGIEMMKIEGLGDCHAIMSERERIRAHMDRTGGTYSRHAHGGNCHVCGAHCIYTVLFHHVPSNTYIRTGMDCADKLEWDSGEGEAFRAKIANAREAQAGKAKAALLLQDKGLSEAYAVYADTGRAEKWEESTIFDIVSKLVKYGSLSDKQYSFLGSLVNKIANRAELEAKRKAENEAAKPFPVTPARITIKGKILTIRVGDGINTFGVKTLVQHVDGWKAWGTLPGSVSNAKVGDTIEFSAKVKVSDKDSKFGFYSRPTKAVIVEG